MHANRPGAADLAPIFGPLAASLTSIADFSPKFCDPVGLGAAFPRQDFKALKKKKKTPSAALTSGTLWLPACSFDSVCCCCSSRRKSARLRGVQTENLR